MSCRVGIYTISLTLENTFGFVTETHEIFATEDHCSVSDVEIGGRSGKKVSQACNGMSMEYKLP